MGRPNKRDVINPNKDESIAANIITDSIDKMPTKSGVFDNFVLHKKAIIKNKVMMMCFNASQLMVISAPAA